MHHVFLVLFGYFLCNNLTTLSVLNSNLPVVERRSLVHSLNSCVSIFSILVKQVGEATGKLRIEVFDDVNVKDGAEGREDFPQTVLGCATRYTSHVDIAVFLRINYITLVVINQFLFFRIISLTRLLLNLVFLNLNNRAAIILFIDNLGRFEVFLRLFTTLIRF